VVGKYGIAITNGNTLTAGMTILGIQVSSKLRHIDLQKSTVAIVGGTGSIGQAVAKILAREWLFKTLILVGRTPANLRKLQTEIQEIWPVAIVETTTDIVSIKNADIIVMATSSSDIILESAHIKRDALIYDITQPQNVSRELKTTRPDVLVVDGALVELPSNVRYYFNLGIPRSTIFACLAETMLLSVGGHQSDFSIGHVTLKNVKYILELAEKYNFKLAPLTSWGHPIQ
jgi:predicted amino acid dehydrogenase